MHRGKWRKEELNQNRKKVLKTRVDELDDQPMRMSMCTSMRALINSHTVGALSACARVHEGNLMDAQAVGVFFVLAAKGSRVWL